MCSHHLKRDFLRACVLVHLCVSGGFHAALMQLQQGWRSGFLPDTKGSLSVSVVLEMEASSPGAFCAATLFFFFCVNAVSLFKRASGSCLWYTLVT